MKNKIFQIFEFGTSWPLSVEFISETVRERGNPSPYYHNVSTHSIKKKHIKIGWVIQILKILKLLINTKTLTLYRSLLLIRPPIVQWKSDLKGEVVSLDRDNLVVFYYIYVHLKSDHISGVTYCESGLIREGNIVVFHYLSASDIWPDKRDVLWFKCPYNRGTTVGL